ncbi:MAG: M18 family aminopeptidase [Deltaproteobacteria bacterium]|nr:M18 family aminopeptidase [Deltaproteobacteria bacterium]
MSNKTVDQFLNFLNKSTSSFLAVENIASELENANYERLSETDLWNLKPSHKYFVERNKTSLITFTVPSSEYSSFKIAAAHTDSPALKIKPRSEEVQNGTLSVGVEVYGGPIINTWLDRELGISGNVVITDENSDLKTVNLLIDRGVAVIPNAPIHLNRQVNKGFEINAQKHLRAIFSQATESTTIQQLERLIADELCCETSNIVSWDLFFHPVQKAQLIGKNSEMLASSRLDNLAMCHAILEGIKTSRNSSSIKVGVFFESEEIGSRTSGGADGSFLSTVLERIILGLGGTREEYLRILALSFLLSTDMAHAFNPGFSEKYDPDHICTVNGGIVLKLNGNMKYCTTGHSASLIKLLCSRLNIPLQTQINRSDIPSGSTIGPIASSFTGINGADVGNPLLAMHSSREFCGVTDHLDMIRLISEFFMLN